MNLQGRINDAGKSNLASYWCAWIVQECGFHVKPLFGFSSCRIKTGFLQIQSQLFNIYCFVVLLVIGTA